MDREALITAIFVSIAVILVLFTIWVSILEDRIKMLLKRVEKLEEVNDD